MLRLLVFLTVINYCHCWDQIAKRTFQAIYPDFKAQEVWKLTFQINRQNSTRKAKEILNNWVDENWVEPGIDGGTTGFYYGRILAPKKADAKRRGIKLLEHRAAVKNYIRYMFINIQYTYFHVEPVSKEPRDSYKEEAVLMRKIFWKADRKCRNDFTCTFELYINNSAVELENCYMSKSFIAGNLRDLSAYYRKYRYSRMLDWKLPSNV